jgi:hypothetical protein
MKLKGKENKELLLARQGFFSFLFGKKTPTFCFDAYFSLYIIYKSLSLNREASEETEEEKSEVLIASEQKYAYIVQLNF